MRLTARAIACWAFACALSGLSPASSSDEIVLAPCEIGGASFMCGVLSAPEDWSSPSGRHIDIFVAVAPATGPAREPDPVFFFYGGPGVGASHYAAGELNRWRNLRSRRDLVFIDQRGTGRSHPLRCTPNGDPNDPRTFAIELFDIEHLRACRDELALGSDLTRYGTSDAVRDFEAVRAALGYEAINAVGQSYGTRVVQEYVRRHPERVRAAVLRGAAAPAGSITEGMAAAFDDALDQFFSSCEAEEACAVAYPALRARTTAWFERARVGGVTATVALEGGDAVEVTAPYGLVIGWIRSRMYSVGEAARLPGLLSAAAAGDAREIVGNAIAWRRGFSRVLAEGMYASVACAEDMPFVDVEHEVAAAQGTWLGDHRVVDQQAACAIWPRAEIPADFKEPVVAATPMLVINGDRDLATGLGWARAVADAAPNGRLVVARNRSHAMDLDWERCLGPIAERFIETADIHAINDACAADLELPDFEIELAADR